MPRIAMSYGPPGHKGVTTIMGMGADDYPPDPTSGYLGKAGWAAVGVWGLGVLLNSRKLRAVGLGGAGVAFGVKYLAAKNMKSTPAPTVVPAAPSAPAGWR